MSFSQKTVPSTGVWVAGSTTHKCSRYTTGCSLTSHGKEDGNLIAEIILRSPAKDTRSSKAPRAIDAPVGSLGLLFPTTRVGHYNKLKAYLFMLLSWYSLWQEMLALVYLESTHWRNFAREKPQHQCDEVHHSSCRERMVWHWPLCVVYPRACPGVQLTVIKDGVLIITGYSTPYPRASKMGEMEIDIAPSRLRGRDCYRELVNGF